MNYTLTNGSLSGRTLFPVPASSIHQKFPQKLDPRLVQKEIRRERRRIERIASNSTSERQVRSRLAKYRFDSENANIDPMPSGFRIHVWSVINPRESICVP